MVRKSMKYAEKIMISWLNKEIITVKITVSYVKFDAVNTDIHIRKASDYEVSCFYTSFLQNSIDKPCL